MAKISTQFTTLHSYEGHSRRLVGLIAELDATAKRRTRGSFYVIMDKVLGCTNAVMRFRWNYREINRYVIFPDSSQIEMEATIFSLGKDRSQRRYYVLRPVGKFIYR